jgi:radical SAM superfamily enzyme YgiQ (UPF0313 family)
MTSLRKRVVLINPPIVAGVSDYTGTGTPYWPITLAQIAAILDDRYEVKICDMYGGDPRRKTVCDKLVLYGVPIDVANTFITKDDVVVVYSGHAIAHTTVIKLIGRLRLSNPRKIIVVENSNFVNAYPLDLFYDDFKKVGATIIAGDPYGVIIKAIEGEGDYDTVGRHLFNDVESLPMPKWEGFPLENYWGLDYAHAPKTNKKYIQIYTSFGCPGTCNFCINKYINKSCWRPKTLVQVIEELSYWCSMGVTEFHIEDLNPSVRKDRIVHLCNFILFHGMRINLKIAAGTKIDYLDEDTLKLMADAGFTYISFSPESGSGWVLKLMNKRFDHKRVLEFVMSMPKKIITQACFVIGYPGETDCDLDMTKKYAIELAKAGVDEFAFFNFVPSVGSKASEDFKNVSTDDMTFSSDWREENKDLRKLRVRWIMELYLIKLMRSPLSTFYRFFYTKTWMTIKRVFLG